ncbi:xanthine dehydrogenase family protein molybdopterin-binding subunit [Actinomadura decatromicini]|uniref:Xanthine dehydrogenase family protein molybdopterin-binding subunit n=1 Tax=Actinomadura decatromicini TaxID=2604572 RepID=A0A5D3F551_9ACTN|nr:xanthine dehydrogenase family protein molybdopterin-binding subunit [Actinomadura decatromicini]TYK44127.1 xanthine dehydrogenase family protein molybdopterin-binding subunit [Actinomadura decatromicini]
MTETEPGGTVIGAGVDRVDGLPKVRGQAPYPSDVAYPGLAHATVVQSVIAAGRLSRLGTEAAEAAPGVLAVITHQNMPRLERGPATLIGPAPVTPLQDDRVLHHGQYVAVVVAETPQQAAAAARLVDVGYEPADALLEIGDPRAELRVDPWGSGRRRGDAEAALASAEVTFEAAYSTAANTNNPIGLFTTVAAWDGDTLTLHDSTQWTANVQATVAAIFGLPQDAVHVKAPYLGGAFGAGLRVWPHVILAAVAARTVGRPVRLTLTRPQMFTGIGHRPSTEQTVRLGATRAGDLVAFQHHATIAIGMADENPEPVTLISTSSYACPNLDVRDDERRLNIPPPGPFRAPGAAQGSFAIESAMDELSYRLGIDPLDLRLRNYAEVEPQSGLRWSSNALRECYTAGAERFGWSERDPAVGSMRDGHWLVGYGVAGVSYHWWQVRCEARATIGRDGTAFVRSAANDIGTGTRTVMTQLSAELLGLGLDDVRFDLGDSTMPWSPAAGGSGLTTSLGVAVHAACRALLRRFLDLAARDADSPLAGCAIDDVTVTGGRIHRTGEPAAGKSYTELLTRHHLDELTADGHGAPPDPAQTGVAPAPPFAAKFAEVRIDADLGILRVARVVTAVDAGRILNEKLARGQIVGGTIGGIGQAILEETAFDAGTGRITNATFGDYLVPVNADVHDIDVVFVGAPDPLTPIGTKGVGELGLPGTAAAIANAVHHATGRRIRSLPITIEQLL